jgi:tRNA threonylcarbamoyladenosine biosynthesis protein TsaE
VSEFVTTSPEETEAVAERLGRVLPAGAVVALTGPLGAGKTRFVQGLARGLGVATPVTSPTFVLVTEYDGRVRVYHVDLFRIDTPAEAMDLGLDELFAGDGVTVIEWAEKLGAALPPDAVRVTIDGVGDEPRRIAIEAGPQL